MRAQNLEPETEALLKRLAPSLPQQWEGASADEIELMEALASRRLPRFYRWFLERMGRSMGPLRYPTLDFSVDRVLSCYENGLLAPDDRFLLIAYESDVVLPLHLFYDFQYPERDDARVVSRAFSGGPIHFGFDTLREMLVWGEFLVSRISKFPHRCRGTLGGNHDVIARLDPIMGELGFFKPIPTGQRCAIYDQPDAAMKIRSVAQGPAGPRPVFDLGGASPEVLQLILGRIAFASAIDVEVRDWIPQPPTDGG